MKGTAKARYGLQFLVELAHCHGQGPLQVALAAERQGLPPKFLRVLLGPLKAAGLIQVARGVGGGCALARHPDRITALEVLGALDAVPSLPGSGEAGAGSRAVGELFARSQEAALRVFAGTRLSDLAERQRSLEGQADYAI